jgi:hypothetical protein
VIRSLTLAVRILHLALRPSPPLPFDAIVGYNALLDAADKPAAMPDAGRAAGAAAACSVLAERVPRYTQRLYALID